MEANLNTSHIVEAVFELAERTSLKKHVTIELGATFYASQPDTVHMGWRGYIEDFGHFGDVTKTQFQTLADLKEKMFTGINPAALGATADELEAKAKALRELAGKVGAA